MTYRLGPAGLIGALLICVAFAIVAFWMMALPGRMQAEAVTLLRQAGLAAQGGTAALSLADGGVAITDMKIEPQGPGPRGSIARIDVSGLLPWQAARIAIDGADLTLAAGGGTATPTAPQGKLEAGSGTVAVSSSRLRLVDQEGAALVTVADISGSLVPVEAGLSFAGQGVFNGRPVSLRLDADDRQRLLADGSPADLYAASRSAEQPFDLQVSGRLRLGAGFALDGRFSSTSGDARTFLSLFGLPGWLPVSGPLAAEGGVSLSAEGFALNDLTLIQGAAEAKGRLALNFGRGSHTIDGVLHLQQMRLPARGGLQPWTDQPMDLSWGKALSGSVTFDAQQLDMGGARFAKPTLNVAFGGTRRLALSAGETGNRLEAVLGLAEDGAASLSVKADAKDGGAILRALTGTAPAEGAVQIDAQVTARGATPIDLVSQAQGTASVKLENGRIPGYALDDLFRTPGDGWRSAPGDETQGVDASLSLSLADGIAKLDGEALKTAAAAYSVSGEIDLLRKALALDVTPKSGPPIGIAGLWSSPRFGPDVEGAPAAPEPPQPGN